MTGHWNDQPYINGLPFRTKLTVECLCKYCGKTVSNFHFHRCSALNAICYRCKSKNHFARMCRFHNPSPVEVRRTKSKSKLKRDNERMKQFIEQKQNSLFPFSGLEDCEVSALSVDSKEELLKEQIAKLKVTNRKFQDEISEVKSENSKLKTRTENEDRLQKALTESLKRGLEDCHYIDKLESDIKYLRTEIDRIAVSFNQQRQEVERLKEKCNSLQCINFKDAKCTNCQHTIQNLKLENSNYKMDIQYLVYELSKNQKKEPDRRQNQSFSARRSRPFNPTRGTHRR